MEAVLFSLCTGVTHIYAPTAELLKLKVFTVMSRNFETALGNLNMTFPEFLDKFSVFKSDKNEMYADGWYIWGNREVREKVLSDPDGYCEEDCHLKIPEFNINKDEIEFFGKLEIWYTVTKK